MTPALLSFPPQAEPSSLTSVFSAEKWACSPQPVLGSELRGPWRPFDAPTKPRRRGRQQLGGCLVGSRPCIRCSQSGWQVKTVSPGSPLLWDFLFN